MRYHTQPDRPPACRSALQRRLAALLKSQRAPSRSLAPPAPQRLGFAVLGYAGYRRSQRRVKSLNPTYSERSTRLRARDETAIFAERSVTSWGDAASTFGSHHLSPCPRSSPPATSASTSHPAVLTASTRGRGLPTPRAWSRAIAAGCSARIIGWSAPSLLEAHSSPALAPLRGICEIGQPISRKAASNPPRTNANGLPSLIMLWTVGRQPRRSVAVGRQGMRQRSATRMAALAAGLSMPGVSITTRSAATLTLSIPTAIRPRVRFLRAFWVDNGLVDAHRQRV
jgi:hypothetical protein